MAFNYAAALATFNAEIEVFKTTLMPASYVKFHKKLALDVLRGIVMRTPVDTGRARANWQVTIDVPPENTVEKEDEGGESTISEGLGELHNLRPYHVIWITNNLPYIETLEDGSSEQAPTGMVAVTLAEQRGIFG
jgi:hypothetical protein